MGDAYEIHQRLAAVQSKITWVGKNQKNPSQGYQFRGIDDLFDAVHPLLAEEEVYIRPKVIDYDCIPLQKGTRWILEVEYFFVADDGSETSCTVIGEAIDYQDKGANKALQQALKYALIQMFTIPTHEPDADSFSPEAVEKEPSKGDISDTERQKIVKWMIDHGADLTDDDRAVLAEMRETIGVASINKTTLEQAQLLRDTMKTLIEAHPEEESE